jgi:cytochrome c-type biogenesis protein CcmH/NrfG
MYLIYSLEIFMLLVMMGMIAVPFGKQRQIFSRQLFGVVSFTLLSVFGLYQFSSDSSGLQNWLSQGREHYQLLEKFNSLGGVDGAIDKIKQKLLRDPSDANGWMLLGKLYMGKQDFLHAKEAFDKAYHTSRSK